MKHILVVLLIMALAVGAGRAAGTWFIQHTEKQLETQCLAEGRYSPDICRSR